MTPSELNALNDQICEYLKLNEDWDGEGSNPANPASVESALNLTPLLATIDGLEVPEPMLHSSGNVGLYWSNSSHYVELELSPNVGIVYFFQFNLFERFKGSTSLVKVEQKFELPLQLEALFFEMLNPTPL